MRWGANGWRNRRRLACIRAHPWVPENRIRREAHAGRYPPRSRRPGQELRQFDLFDAVQRIAAPEPDWKVLPEAARPDVMTALTRLMLDHRRQRAFKAGRLAASVVNQNSRFAVEATQISYKIDHTLKVLVNETGKDVTQTRSHNEHLHLRLHSKEGGRDAAGIVETLPRVLPVPGYLYAARAGVACHRRDVSLTTIARGETWTNRPAPPPFSSIMARHRRWLAA